MSRREDRNFDSKRHRSRFDREPSPKRSRRDGKPGTERPPADIDFDKDHLDRGQKHQRRLQDALPLEAPSAQGSKVETQAVSKEAENKTNGHREGTKHSSDPTKIPRSESYFQHDDRRSAGQVGRSFSRRTDTEHGWRRDPKEQHSDRMEKKAVSSDKLQKEEKAKDNGEDNRVWRHDGYFEMEADPKPYVRKRPSFREQKIPADPEKTDKAITNPQDLQVDNVRRGERENVSRNYDRPERSFMKEREAKRGEAWRGNSSRERYGNSSGFRGRDRLGTRQSYRPTGGRVEKWKHDLYEESNRSPTQKNEEDQIAKIEALLAS
ncbi:nuclear speckle splicing regulatory protein 1-like isoform X1 [Olea europaea var. sylvestris]|uniref:nuclear speckle splicing regulatory protein 1-like isoform X1 n=1 Tax=Olea europaea var. sylvestris TaxID=158386 RepID=UPI000C1CE7FF|nr:nuclear speckle splicing regulatory protein 1-like isoform X1 [Olea europaea var. sylvestris]